MSERAQKFARSGWTALLALWAVWKASTGIRENDTFWHLGLGREVLRQGTRAVHEPWALPDFPSVCVVPEWLWDVTLYALHRAGGMFALQVFVLCAAALVPIALATALLTGRKHASFGSFALVSGLCAVAVSARMSERPDVLSLSFIAFAIACGERFASDAAQRKRNGIAWIVLTLLWAQVHGTFVLAPCIFGAFWVPRLLVQEQRSEAVRDGAWLLGILLAALSNAHGLGALHYVLAHTHGDAVQHITDMKPPSWAQLNPRTFLFLPLSLSLSSLGVLGALVQRRVNLAHVLLALGGLYLESTALRGCVLAALLSAPWALDGAVALATLLDPPQAPRLHGLVRWLVPLSLLILLTREVDARYGPLLHFGLMPANFPVAASRWLARAPKGTRALTSYAAGAYVGYALDGRVRTFVDSRTPMYFSDLDYALSRDAFASPNDVVRATRRFGFEVAVVRRDLPGCDAVAASGLFEPVLIEPRHTLFVRHAGPLSTSPLVSLRPCGRAFVERTSCANAEAAARDLHTVASFAATFAGFLRLERAVTCGQPLADAVKSLPSEEQAQGYEEQYQFVLAQVLLAGGRFAAAADLVRELALAGDEQALWLSIEARRRAGDEPALVTLLASTAETLDDAMPPDLRAELARSCLQTGDTACARFHATRAAARGSLRALPVLEALAKQSPARGSEARWLDALRAP